jgi:hypothetical protein
LNDNKIYIIDYIWKRTKEWGPMIPLEGKERRLRGLKWGGKER